MRYELGELQADMSFLEALDVPKERLMERGDVPVAFDHDCREPRLRTAHRKRRTALTK